MQQLCPRANILTAAQARAAKDMGFTVRAWGLRTAKVSALHKTLANLQLILDLTGFLHVSQDLLQALKAGAQGGTVDNLQQAQQLLLQHQVEI
jgi:hypothetical protein